MGAFYSRVRSIPFSLSVTKIFSKHNNFKFKGFIIMFSFFVTVAEGAEGQCCQVYGYIRILRIFKAFLDYGGISPCAVVSTDFSSHACALLF